MSRKTNWHDPFRDYICLGEGAELTRRTVSAPSAAIAAEFFIEDADLSSPGTYKVFVKAPNGTMREFLVDLMWEPSASSRETRTVRQVDKRVRRVRKSDWWQSEPAVGRVANGIPKRVDRLRCLGNAVVPQVAEFVGRRVVEILAPNPPEPQP